MDRINVLPIGANWKTKDGIKHQITRMYNIKRGDPIAKPSTSFEYRELNNDGKVINISTLSSEEFLSLLMQNGVYYYNSNIV